MKKYIFTFGSSQLNEFFVRPTGVALIVEAENENIARNEVFQFPGIGGRFCTSYLYDEYIDEFINEYGMTEYTLDELEKLRINQNMMYPDYSGFQGR